MTSSLPTTGTINDIAAMAVIDEAERRVLELLDGQHAPTEGGTPESCPVRNFFTPGLYCREIFMPAGAVVISRVHALCHPFIISKGRALVYMGGEQPWVELVAPHFGITEPGTRRLLFITEDCVWTTFHVTDKTDVDEIVRDITIPYENPLLKEAV